MEGEDSKSVGLYDKPLVVEGKRKRKSIDTFAISHEPKRPTSEYTGGVGVKLGDITRIEHYISRNTASELRSLHRICFDRQGSRTEIKRNLREFNGFPFDRDSELYARKRTSLSKFTKVGLRQFLELLDLSVGGSKEEQIERILEFLLAPQNSGRGLKKRKRKSSSSETTSSKKAKTSTSEAEDDEDEDIEEEEEEDKKSGVEAANIKEEDEVTVKKEEKEELPEGAPTDTELFYDVQDVLRGADLETLTTNAVYQQIFEKYPGIDMTTRKDYIKSCIAKLLT